MKKSVTFFALIGIFCIVLLLAVYFNITSGETTNPNGEDWQETYYLSGPDPYYNMRSITLTMESGHYPWGDLDPLLNYPVGHVGSARPPLMNMLAIGFSRLLSPFMPESDAIGYSTQFLPSLFGALLIFPVYFIGKVLFDKKTGLVAAMLVAFIPIHISSGHGASFTLFDHDAFNLLMFAMIYCFYIYGIKSKNPRKNIYYGILAGACLGALSMVWVSAHFTYTIIALFFTVQTIINLLRSKFDKHLCIVTFLALLTGYLIFLPLGFVKILELFLVMFTALLIGFSYIIYKWKIPWIITVPSIGIAGIISVGFLYLVRNTTNPLLTWTEHFSGILFGGGIYGDKVALTIAEAKTFDMSRTVMSFGPSLYWIALIGFVFTIWFWHKNKDRSDYLFFISLFIIEMWFIGTAGRFLNDFIPLVVISSSFVITYMLTKFDYKRMIRNIRYLGTKRFYKGVKFLQVAGIVIVVFVILLPNAFMVIEASIPQVEQKEYFGDDFSGYFGTSHYKEMYWVDALTWLNHQDTELQDADKPGFISWWDYGFYEVAVGRHPTVADNFQEGFQAAGNFLTAQTEEEAQALMITRLIEGNMHKNNDIVTQEVRSVVYSYFPPNLDVPDSNETFDMWISLRANQTNHKEIWKQFPGEELIDVIQDPELASSYDTLISPEYGNTELRVTYENARYHDGMRIITESLTDEQITQFLLDIEKVTGTSIRYFGVEGYDMQIFDVFTFLSDRGLFGIYSSEDDYKILNYVDKNGDKWTQSELVYMDMARRNELAPFSTETTEKEAYFNTMVYRAYIQATNGLRHFRPVYLSPYGYPGQNRVAVIITKYYPGCNITGMVTLDGIPMANTMIALYDEYDLLHDYTGSDDYGEYSLISVAGNNTIRVFIGEEIVYETQVNITEDEANRVLDTQKAIPITIAYGNISGYITNNTGNVMELVSQSYVTEDRFSIIADDGYYEFDNVIPGNYQIVIGDYNTTLFIMPGMQKQNFTIGGATG